MSYQISQEALERKYLADLHVKWFPHPGQIRAGQAIFREGKRRVGVQCGRGWGKSEFVLYVGSRKAALTPDLPVYLLTPWAKQGVEVYWRSNRLQNFNPSWVIKKIYQQEKRIVFQNGSFIKLDGSDSPDIHRGPVMGFVVMDEFKDFHYDCWPAIRPNLIKWKDWAFYVSGTPPDNDSTPQEKGYLNLMRECATSVDGFHVTAPSSENPNLDLVELANIEHILTTTGREDEWQREYLGKFVKGGSKTIIPSFNKAIHVIPHDQLLEILRVENTTLDPHVSIDPGSGGNGSRWAELYSVYSQEKHRLCILDELVESDMKYTSTSPMQARQHEKLTELSQPLGFIPTDWLITYDEAALWFYQERQSLDIPPDHCNNLVPTSKANMKAQNRELKAGISLIKDGFSRNDILISDRCKNLIWEIESYCMVTNREGVTSIPDENDDTIDAFRYKLYACGYKPSPTIQPLPAIRPVARQGRPSVYAKEEADYKESPDEAFFNDLSDFDDFDEF
jgi:hypothetical protein